MLYRCSVKTVVARIFYQSNRGANDMMSLPELKHSRIHETLVLLDRREDINEVSVHVNSLLLTRISDFGFFFVRTFLCDIL